MVMGLLSILCYDQETTMNTKMTDSVNKAVFSADGQTILSGSHDKTLILWDTATGRLVRQFGGETAISSIEFGSIETG